MQDIKTLTLISACERPRKRGWKGGGGGQKMCMRTRSFYWSSLALKGSGRDN